VHSPLRAPGEAEASRPEAPARRPAPGNCHRQAAQAVGGRRDGRCARRGWCAPGVPATTQTGNSAAITRSLRPAVGLPFTWVLRQPNAAPVSRIGRHGAPLEHRPAWRDLSAQAGDGSRHWRSAYRASRTMATPTGDTEEPHPHRPAAGTLDPGIRSPAHLGSRCVIDRGLAGARTAMRASPRLPGGRPYRAEEG